MNKEIKDLILIIALMIVTAIWVNHAYGESIWQKAKAEQAQLEANQQQDKTDILFKELTDLLDANPETLTYTDYTKAMELVRKINKLGNAEIVAFTNLSLVGFMAISGDKLILDSIPRNVDCTLTTYYTDINNKHVSHKDVRETKSTYVEYNYYIINVLDKRIYFKDGSEPVDIIEGKFDDIVYTKDGILRLKYNASFKKGQLKKITIEDRGYLPFVIEVK